MHGGWWVDVVLMPTKQQQNTLGTLTPADRLNYFMVTKSHLFFFLVTSSHSLKTTMRLHVFIQNKN